LSYKGEEIKIYTERNKDPHKKDAFKTKWPMHGTPKSDGEGYLFAYFPCSKIEKSDHII